VRELAQADVPPRTVHVSLGWPDRTKISPIISSGGITSSARRAVVRSVVGAINRLGSAPDGGI
jgi:hypothetical protein